MMTMPQPVIINQTTLQGRLLEEANSSITNKDRCVHNAKMRAKCHVGTVNNVDTVNTVKAQGGKDLGKSTLPVLTASIAITNLQN